MILWPAFYRRLFTVIIFSHWKKFWRLLLGLIWVLPLGAQVKRLPSAPAGRLESGAPPFAIFGAAELSMAVPPTDVHLMPDGRILLFASRQIMLGDGVRWQAFQQAPETKTLPTLGVAVNQQGQIYMGAPGGFSRVQFDEDGFWRLVTVAPWPSTEKPDRAVPRSAIEVGKDWFWHSGSGAVIAWRPGETARTVARVNRAEHIFTFKGKTYLSERGENSLSLLGSENPETVLSGPLNVVDNAVTCSQPFDVDTVLVGTFGNGLQRFDGSTFQPFFESGVLAGGSRINDLCRTEGDFYAAAVENHGVVFFDHTGRIIQFLDRSLDHRLARVTKLLPAPGGVIWGLMDDGLLRIEFPARVSNFEHLFGTALNAVHPVRFEGKLWCICDGKTYQGIYDAQDRFTHLEIDSPAGCYVSAFAPAGGLLIAGTDHGGYYRSKTGWVRFAPESLGLRILDSTPRNGRLLYGAINELGWMHVENGRPVIERFPVPKLDTIYLAHPVAGNRIWLELGNRRLGRIHFESDQPVVEYFGEQDGVPDGWAQVFEIDGVAGFNIADQILRFDEPTRRFFPDTAFSAKYSHVSEIVGRPGLDASGRLWISSNSGVKVLEKRGDSWQIVPEKMPAGLRPFYFTFEENGVIWMHVDRHFARFDPSLPVAPPVPLHAIITHVNLVTSNRTLFAVDRALAPINYADNSLNAHFMAPGNPFAAPVTFEVMLEGAGNEWVSTGGTGSAVFNRLKEGHYVLHVRPRSDDKIGTEATLAFSIRPPWFRSSLAYVIYTVTSTAGALFIIWLVTYLQRRENGRLEQLVAKRTSEQEESNRLLASQVVEIRMLSQAIGQSPVSVLITQSDGTIVFANPRATDLSGYAAAELVGQKSQILRSELVTSQLLEEITATVQEGKSWHGQLANRRKDGTVVHVRTTISPIRNPENQTRLHLILEEDISEWLADQERNQRLEAQLFQSQKLESIGTLAGGIAHDFNNILTSILGYCELAGLDAAKDSELMKQLKEIRSAGLRARDLVARILTFSRRGATTLVPIDLVSPVTEALRLIRASTPTTITISTQLESGTVRADSTQIQQVVLNLCTNAVHAIGKKNGHLTISLSLVDADVKLASEVPALTTGPYVRLAIADDGHGMHPGTLNRIFDPFFTTKPQGEGTGLGLSIVQGILAGHHGAIRVQSIPNSGTTFELYFPRCAENARPPALAGPDPRGALQEVLLVDDEPSVVAFASTRLQQLGYRVLSFSDPRAALNAFQANPTRFQVLVTDLTMPHLTGVELIQHIRATGREIPAIIITGYGRETGGTKLETIPRCQVLRKPFSGEDLANAVSLALQ